MVTKDKKAFMLLLIYLQYDSCCTITLNKLKHLIKLFLDARFGARALAIFRRIVAKNIHVTFRLFGLYYLCYYTKHNEDFFFFFFKGCVTK